MDLCLFRECLNPVTAQNADAGHHRVIPAGEPAQHRLRLRFVPGLAQALAVNADQGIGGDDAGALGCLGQNGLRL